MAVQVEKKERGGDWQVVSQQLVADTRFTVPCVEGKTYDFRVSAVNAGGPGEPSKTAGPHLCRENIGIYLLVSYVGSVLSF